MCERCANTNATLAAVATACTASLEPGPRLFAKILTAVVEYRTAIKAETLGADTMIAAALDALINNNEDDDAIVDMHEGILTIFDGIRDEVRQRVGERNSRVLRELFHATLNPSARAQHLN